MKELRERYGLSQTDIVRLLGYHNKANVSHCENAKKLNSKYISAIQFLGEAMQLTTDKINSWQLKEPTFLVAKKQGFVRRIYSNNQNSINILSIFLNREVIYRKNELYKYEIIVF